MSDNNKIKEVREEVKKRMREQEELIKSGTDSELALQAKGEKVKFILPSPDFPKLDMPVSPDVPHKDKPKLSSDYDNCELPNLPNPELPKGKIRILIGIPLLDIKYEFFESFMKFWTQVVTQKDCPYEIGYHIAYRKPVHMAEEYLVRIAQANKCTHLLLMDDDIYDVTVEDLHKLIRADKDFISGVMYASKFPHAMCVFRRYDTTKKVMDMPADNSLYRLYEVPALCPHCGVAQSHWDVKFCCSCGSEIDLTIQEADLTPFPFTLIKMSVFDKLKYPWFHCTNQYPSDSWFADRMLEAGLKEYAHMLVRLNHAGISDATRPHYFNMGLEKAKATGGVVNMPPEDMQRHQWLLHNRMMEAEAKIKAKPPIISEGKIVDNITQQKDLTLMTHGH